MLRTYIPKMKTPGLSKVLRSFWSGRNNLQKKSNTTSANPDLPDHADVVIIGGGNIGINTLYHLSKRGVNAVLLERNKLTSGTTWHTAGLVWSLRPSDVEIQLLKSTRETLLQLKDETGLDPGFICNGGLYIAHNNERMDEYRRLATIGTSFNIDARIVDPQEAHTIFPLLDPSVIVGGLYCPGDGSVDPSSLATALTKAAKKNGGKIFENCPVSNILIGETQFGSKQVSGVKTPFGTISTNCVVNCSGAWGNKIAGMVGLQLPLIPMKHAYVVSESIPRARDLPNVRDHDGSVYFRVQGDALYMGGYEKNPQLLDNIPEDFAFSLYDLDWTTFPHLSNAVKLVPQFETVGIKSTVCGPESFTPDHKPLLGEDPRLSGLYQGVGFNSAGMMLGSGCGEQLALWIIHGRPDLHMYSFDVSRFTLSQLKNKEWAKERSHESYATNYAIVFPNDQFLAGRNLKLDPFHEELLEAGCVFEEIQGWERPGWFAKQGPNPVPPYDWGGSYGTIKNTDTRYEQLLKQDFTFDFPIHHEIIGEECRNTRENVSLFNTSYLAKLYLTGPDAQAAADWLFTADTREDTGKALYSLLLNSNGGVEADGIVTPIETGSGGLVDPIIRGRGFYVVAGGASASHTKSHIRNVIQEKGFRVKVDDITDNIGVLSIQGPNSRKLLEAVVKKGVSDEDFPALTSQLMQIRGHTCRVFRISSVGELGYQIHIPWQSCLPVYKNIWKEGKRFSLKHAGYRALFSLNAEDGFHQWHHDLRNDDNPLEANLEFTCRLEGEYLGKEALGRVKYNGVKKRLCIFHLNCKVPVWGLETIWRNDKVVGFVRRADYAFTLQTSIAHGYIRNPDGGEVNEDYIVSGNYEIEIMGKRYPASVYLKSPFDPNSKRLLGVYDT